MKSLSLPPSALSRPSSSDLPVNPPRKRLDQVLVERGLMPSRARAQSAIRAGEVSLGGAPVTRPAHLVGDDDEISVSSSVHKYVSRAALKLVHGLDYFDIDVRDKICVDIGASTGGFTQVLLERHAAHVTAIDVGHGQLVPALASNPRVTSIEGLNAKDVTLAHLGTRPDILTCDVSFISLTKALMKTLDLLQERARILVLIKPQFEVGPAHVGKGGIIRDPELHAKVCDNITQWLAARGGWELLGITESPIEGGDGNKEFLMAARRL
jgi:23S rRNA (cytidine1920-2'-O)/16S rRNA (cytidine1409-2'-O)-methyltransferase